MAVEELSLVSPILLVLVLAQCNTIQECSCALDQLYPSSTMYADKGSY